MFNFKRKTIRDIAVKRLAEEVIAYAGWYQTHGLALPPKYAKDPGAWNDALYRIARAFELLEADLKEEGPYWEAKHCWHGKPDAEKVKQVEQEINEGLLLFGENLLYLTDLIKTN